MPSAHRTFAPHQRIIIQRPFRRRSIRRCKEMCKDERTVVSDFDSFRVLAGPTHLPANLRTHLTTTSPARSPPPLGSHLAARGAQLQGRAQLIGQRRQRGARCVLCERSRGRRHWGASGELSGRRAHSCSLRAPPCGRGQAYAPLGQHTSRVGRQATVWAYGEAA